MYGSADCGRSDAPLHFAGQLLPIGRVSDLEGSMAVFSTREAAEQFASGDPFVLNGPVTAPRHARRKAASS